ncbi:MAG: type I-F CRISPR-associated protein Csy3 [Legionella sp.]|nr:MAG: type I-F CRISPR-associated protein Csy3 [Legionella sp.]PJD98432.1 MAG: type I-F CRISPR-associated protein Csy3 [Legionella sp.]
MAKENKIPSVLAFEKKLVPSDGYMYGTTWQNKEHCSALKLQEKSVRGTISNRLKATIKNDPLKLNAEIEKANLQRIDACSLEPHQDTLKLHFTVKVLGGIMQPSACNSASFQQSYREAVQCYLNTYQFTELAKRYAINIANARFLWRNRLGAEQIEVHVSARNNDYQQQWTFNSNQFSIRHFNHQDKNIDELASVIAAILRSVDDFILLDITCYAKVGKAQEVYPSEELVLDKGKNDKSKILYAVNDVAALHSQKLGNALRTIDTWYPEYHPEQDTGPIAIEPYGAVTNLGHAYRTPKEKQDFYSLFDVWARGGSLGRAEDEHYVMAVLVRGGIFGESDK